MLVATLRRCSGPPGYLLESARNGCSSGAECASTVVPRRNQTQHGSPCVTEHGTPPLLKCFPFRTELALLDVVGAKLGPFTKTPDRALPQAPTAPAFQLCFLIQEPPGISVLWCTERHLKDQLTDLKARHEPNPQRGMVENLKLNLT